MEIEKETATDSTVRALVVFPFVKMRRESFLVADGSAAGS